VLGRGIIEGRIIEAERYLTLLDRDYGSDWELYRADAESKQDLAEALSLIHPDRWRHLARRDDVQGERTFKVPVLYSTRLCVAKDYWGVECRVDTRREGANADHAWPYAFGGPTDVANIVWLCPRHNHIKGSDVHFYTWEAGWPPWLARQLDRVSRAIRYG
jgi:hypothetical protein